MFRLLSHQTKVRSIGADIRNGEWNLKDSIIPIEDYDGVVFFKQGTADNVFKV